MTKQPTRMLYDPNEPTFVRELLQAGAADQVTDYDYNKGLAKHLTVVAAGTLLPVWAKGLVSGSGTSSTVSGLSAKVIAFIVGLPIVTAGVVASIVISNQEPKMRPTGQTEPTAAQTSQNRSLTGRREVARLEGTTTQNLETSDVQNPVRPTKGINSPEPHYPQRTTKQSIPLNSAMDRRVVKKIRARELSSSKPVVLEMQRATSATAQPTTEERHKERVSSTPIIERRAVSKLRRERQERAKKPRVVENQFERETRMLAAANRLLESDPERSLELARKGEREFPDSMFTEERRHVLILALIRLSRLDEARQIAGPYLLDYPKSPFAQRIRHALAKAQQER